MTDEEYIYRRDIAEKKRTARGSSAKKGQGGRIVRLPSDNMTRKERNALSGECKSYELGKPVKWEQFKVWPDDIKKEYITRLREQHGATTGELCEMFSISKPTMWKTLSNIGLEFDRRMPNAESKKLWTAFLNGEAVEPEEEPEPEPEEVPEAMATKLELDRLDRLEMVFRLLRGTGAKVTIQFEL